MTSNSRIERPRFRRVAWRVVPSTIWLVSRIVWRLRIKRGDGFPEPPFVIAANHYSFLDPPMVSAAWKGRVRFLTLDDLFGNFRWLDFTLDTFEVIRVKRGARALGPVRKALDYLRQGGVVAVFPEGTRAERFGDKPFAAGAAWLAVKAGVPVVPVAISGTEKVLGIDNRLRRGRVRVAIGPALNPVGSGRTAVNDLTKRWSDWITTELNKAP